MVAMFVAAGSELVSPHPMTAAVFAATQAADGGIFRQSLVNFLVSGWWGIVEEGEVLACLQCVTWYLLTLYHATPLPPPQPPKLPPQRGPLGLPGPRPLWGPVVQKKTQKT